MIADAAEIVIEQLEGGPLDRRPVEIVERKGRGHPDTLADAAAEAFSVGLCHAYLQACGRILHHNVDKAVLMAGESRAEFGGGEVIRPLRLVHVGRATRHLENSDFRVDEIGAQTAREVFAAALRHLDCRRHLQVQVEVRPTSAELTSLFARSGAVPLANDTSIGVGYAPLSETERLVLAVERCLTAPATLAAHPYLGEDVKVLAVRVRERIRLTVAAAFVARHVRSLAHYLECKQRVDELARQCAGEITARELECGVNTADDPHSGSIYLTVTGTSAEAGDDGQVGRGNRANGLITPARIMSLEAIAGKNPVSHVGKIYNVWASRLCQDLVDEPGIEEAQCQLASRIGRPIDEPQVVHLAVRGAAAKDEAELRTRIRNALASLPEMWKDIAAGRLSF